MGILQFLQPGDISTQIKARLGSQKVAFEVFEGCMLGDAGLFMDGHNALFSIGLSGKEHLDWLGYIRVALLKLGAEISPNYPKVSPASSRGKPYNLISLLTKTSPFFTAQQHRWYKNGSKEVPEDLVLNSTSLANWFMGDGGSDRDKRKKNALTVYTRMSTQGFNSQSIELLRSQLSRLGILTGRSRYKNIVKGSGIRLNVSQYSVNRFMAIVEPYILPSYTYKIKYKGGRSEIRVG